MSGSHFLARLQNKVHASVLSSICEKEYTAENGQTLRYMFFPAQSDILSSDSRHAMMRERGTTM